MDLICYLHPGWRPHIRPAPAKRDWMDATPESYAYRCLPLNIANAHGWEILSPVAFDARWNGGAGIGDVEIRLADDTDPRLAPVSLFGSGILTFHIEGLFRTEPGWNLWLGGSPNRPKDAIQPLSGVIETDWSPFTFTMNWRFTRPGQWVRFEAGEPIAFFFPVQRGVLDAIAPTFADLDAAPELKASFLAWSGARDAFHAKQAVAPGAAPTDRWQKHYYRGVDIAEAPGAPDHQAKLRLAPFTGGPDLAPLPEPPPAPAVAPSAPAADSLALRKRDWLLRSLEAQRRLAPDGLVIERRGSLGRDEFLARYYAPARPVILTGEMDGWPALELWTPDYLACTVGAQVIEYQGGRTLDPSFEMYKDNHRREAPFDAFMAQVTAGEGGNDAYITAYNSQRNLQALSVLDKDLGFMGKILSPQVEHPHGMKWIGPAGTVTSLHHDLTNNLIAQVRGSKRIRLVAAAEAGRMYNATHVFSDIKSFDDPLAAFPLAEGLTVYDGVLGPGEALFVPLGWWHEVRSLEFSVTLTYTNFLWPNDAYATYPAG